MRNLLSVLLVVTLMVLLSGCVETPKHPVLVQIPPPPPIPPPGVAYVPSTNSTQIQTNQAGFNITSNYVAGAQGMVSTNTQAMPQFETVPPRPGASYTWRSGFWRWNGAYEWVPGEWVYNPPAVIFVPEPYYYHYPYGPPWPYRYGRRGYWR